MAGRIIVAPGQTHRRAARFGALLGSVSKARFYRLGENAANRVLDGSFTLQSPSLHADPRHVLYHSDTSGAAPLLTLSIRNTALKIEGLEPTSLDNSNLIMPPIESKIVLASGSPRRRELMQEAGYDFEVMRPSDSAECGMCSGESPPEMVARLAKQKCEDVAQRVDSAIVIGSDTVAECTGRILGKPHHVEHARQMLHAMRGREHRVYTGVCVWQRPSDQFEVAVEVTHLRMDDISDAAIEEYLATDLWEGKAGAFGLQDRQGWIQIVEGSESNVVGLPMELLEKMLAKFAA